MDEVALQKTLCDTRDRLAATQEILDVIRDNTQDEQPVFAAILKNASQLCVAPTAALLLLDARKNTFHVAARWGEKTGSPDPTKEWDLNAELPVAECLREARTIHIPDTTKAAPYIARHPTYLLMVDTDGLRARLCVPLLREGKAFGVIALSRLKPEPFDAGEISLVESFATQAVIAIENVRQFRAIQTANAELETRLEREAASREILDVISRTQGDGAPVFEAVLRRAATLCGAPMASVNIVDEDRKNGRLVAHWGDTLRHLEVGETVWPLEYEDGAERFTEVSMRDGVVMYCEDLKETERYRSGDPHRCAIVDEEGIRTFLAVPLLRDGQSIGNIALYRRETVPFTDDQIALVETFAAQAVIAIENIRQFKALEQLNAELGARVEEQVGEIERMGRLKRFLPAAVADTIVSTGTEKLLSSHRALLGVLFCDIRGFTAFCETAEPEETIEVLQTYHEEMGKLINAHGAGVDHRMGDGIMVLFNDPLPCDDPAGDAVRLAIAMRSRMAELSKRWKRLGYRLGFGVGVSLGYATVGMVGFEGRFDYTASGTAINLASRLSDEAKDGQVLLSPRAAIAVEDSFEVTSTGHLDLKGIREPIEVFKLADTAPA